MFHWQALDALGVFLQLDLLYEAMFQSFVMWAHESYEIMNIMEEIIIVEYYWTWYSLSNQLL